MRSWIKPALLASALILTCHLVASPPARPAEVRKAPVAAKASPKPAPKAEAPPASREPAPEAPAFVAASEPVADGKARIVLTTLRGAPVPDEWPLGMALGLTIRDSDMGVGPDAVRWEIEPDYLFDAAWPVEGQTGLIVSTGTDPAILVVRISVAKGDTVDVLTRRIALRPRTPPPGPNPPNPPVPPVPPDPPAPEPLSDLATSIRSAFALALPGGNYKADLDTFAKNFAKVAAEIQQAMAGAGNAELKDPEAIIHRTASLNHGSVANPAIWVPAFTGLQVIMDNLDAEGKLVEPGDYVDAYLEIAKALRSIP